MNLKIEEWSHKNLTDSANELMKESILCYKVGAYRSAYLMSYLAFKQTIRERIINAPSYPNSYNDDTEWEISVLKPLKNDDKWEETINEIIKSNEKSKKFKGIFSYQNRERMLNRYEYWKNIRNSCAHAKDEHIDSATVEQFWNYMQDDMNEFYVLGGEKYLLDELVRRHKYYACDTDKDISNLLDDIKVVYRNKLGEFFNDFLKSIEKQHIDIINDSNYNFWRDIIYYKEDCIKDNFALCISKNERTFLDLFKYYPNILGLIVNNDQRFIQDYVNSLLDKKLSNYYKYDECFWKLLICSLKIQPNILDLDSITNNYNNLILIEKIELEKKDEMLLNEYDIFKKFIFKAGREFFQNDSGSHWDYYIKYNKSDEYIKKCFDYLKWDKEVTDKLESAYSSLLDYIDQRYEYDSINRGKKRLRAYEEIIEHNRDKILRII